MARWLGAFGLLALAGAWAWMPLPHRPEPVRSRAPAPAESSAPALATAPAVSRVPETPALKIESSDDVGGIEGVVLDERGEPVPNALVACDGADDLVKSRTDGDGHFVCANLGPGDYRVAAFGDELAAPWEGPLPLAPGETLAGLVLVAEPGRYVGGTVVGDDGVRVIGGVYVCAGAFADSGEVRCAYGDAEGFRVGPLPRGPVRLRVSVDDGYQESRLDVYAGQESLLVRLARKTNPPDAREEPERPDDEGEAGPRTRPVRVEIAGDVAPFSGFIYSLLGKGDWKPLPPSSVVEVPERAAQLCVSAAGGASTQDCRPLDGAVVRLHIDRLRSMMGLVRRADGEPAARVRVACGHEDTETGAEGAFQLMCRKDEPLLVGAPARPALARGQYVEIHL